MPNTDHSDILDLLTTGVNEAEALVELLELEKTQLENRDISGLEQILPRKNDSVARLETIHNSCQSNPRYTLLAERQRREPSEDGTDKREESQEQTLSELYEKFRELSLKCSYINNLNGILIVNSKNRNKACLDNLKGKTKQNRLYDAAGSTARTLQQDSQPTFLSSLG